MRVNDKLNKHEKENYSATFYHKKQNMVFTLLIKLKL